MPNYSGPWYFLSALSQCASAFAALVAVFATFRLQVNHGLVEEAIADARQWVLTQRGRDAIVPDEAVKEFLKNVRGGVIEPGNKEKADQLLKRIEHHEKFPGVLADELGVPLKLWVAVFGISVSPLAMVELSNRFVLFLILVLGALTVLAVIASNSFIQECLGRAAGPHQLEKDKFHRHGTSLAKMIANTKVLYGLGFFWICLLVWKYWGK